MNFFLESLCGFCDPMDVGSWISGSSAFSESTLYIWYLFVHILYNRQFIKKRWQEYTDQLYNKDLHDPYNHDGMVTHLDPDILECEVNWALGKITTNKASGDDGIPVELFQILKMML